MFKIYFDDQIPEHILELVKKFDFDMCSLTNCDFIISCKFKTNINYTLKQTQELLFQYSYLPKKVIVILLSNIEEPINIPYNVMLLRKSLLKSKKKNNECVFPMIWDCYNSESFKPMKITNFPVIGYFGTKNKYNERTISIIQNTDNIITNIYLKSDIKDTKNEELLIRTIEESHFYLCLKEDGNYPSQLYKVLSLGRIPIIIDNDFCFLFEDEINWNEIAIIGKNEIEVIQKLKKLWVDNDIIKMQQTCKNIAHKFFNINTYINNIFINLYDPYNIYNIFSFPIDFDINIYNKYIDLEQLSYSDLIKHYLDNGQKEGRIYKLPPNFTVNGYRKKNPDLINLNYDQLIKHYIYNGSTEKRLF